MSLESYGVCTKEISEECRLHPADCGSCQAEAGCQLKATFKTHPDKIKRCQWFRRKKGLTGFLEGA